MFAILTSWIWDLVRLAAVAAGAFYVVCVLVTYAHTGGDYRTELDPSDRMKSMGHALLWMGVQAATLAIIAGKKLFDYFSESSAEVGDWLISKSPRLQSVVARARPR